MKILVIDATHGGIKIAVSFAKAEKYEEVYIFDVYNTLKDLDKKYLDVYNVKIINLEDLSEISGDLLVISPVHLPYTNEEIKVKINNPNLNYEFINHHEAVKLILDKWLIKHPEILKVEVTGVKGKTSSVFMLKEILNEYDPLILSSLGAYLTNNGKDKILKKDISITPANIKETIDLAYKIDNPICFISKGIAEAKESLNYKAMILENSLGACGIGDVGLLTNIAENYPIANNTSDARTAKKQIFKCNISVCEKETLNKYYPDEDKNKINTFSLNNLESNLIAENIDYNLDKTSIDISYKDLLTINNNRINGKFNINTFAPGKYHVENVLGVVTTALSLEIPESTIIKGLNNFNGIEGRTSKEKIKNSTIISEVNPGINAKAIEYSINMIENLENYSIVLGGDYGVTCEEINEENVADVLNNVNKEIILTGAVGKSIKEKLNKPCEYFEDYEDSIIKLIEANKNILFIYRSNYKELSKR